MPSDEAATRRQKLAVTILAAWVLRSVKPADLPGRERAAWVELMREANKLNEAKQ